MAKQRILLYDTFTGDNSTELTAHAPNKQAIASGAWSTLTGHTIPQIQSNQASATADATDNSAIFDIGRIHCKIVAKVTAGTTSGATNWVKFLFRCLDVNEYWCVKVGEVSSGVFSLQIIRSTGGSETVKDSRTCTFADATEYDIEISATGNQVYVKYGDGGADLNYRVRNANAVGTSTGDWYAPGTNVGIWEYVAATSTTYPLVNEIKVYG